MDVNFLNQNSCFPGVFQFDIFFSVFLSTSMCISNSGPSLSPSCSLVILFIHSAFSLCFFGCYIFVQKRSVSLVSGYWYVFCHALPVVCYYYYYYYYYYYLLPFRVFHINDIRWFLSEVWVTANLIKSPELFSVFSRMVSTSPFIPIFSNPCTNRLLTVPWAPITLGITVTFMFHRFWNRLQGQANYSTFHFLFNYIQWSGETANFSTHYYYYYYYYYLLFENFSHQC